MFLLTIIFDIRCAHFVSQNKIKQKMDIIEKENYKVVEVRLPILHATNTHTHARARASKYAQV